MAHTIVEIRLNPLIPTKAELGGLLALIVFYLTYDVVFKGDDFLINILGPSVLFLVLASAAWISVKRDALMIWAPLFSFRVATAIFFGIGSLAPFFVDETARASLEAFYLFSNTEISKLNLIVACCVFVGTRDVPARLYLPSACWTDDCSAEHPGRKIWRQTYQKLRNLLHDHWRLDQISRDLSCCDRLGDRRLARCADIARCLVIVRNLSTNGLEPFQCSKSIRLGEHFRGFGNVRRVAHVQQNRSAAAVNHISDGLPR